MIEVSENQVTYLGDGETTEFSYEFKIIDSTDIKLIRVDSNGNETNVINDFYVDMTAGKVYYPGYAPGAEEPGSDTPPVLRSGEKLIIYRDVPITQLAEMPDQWPYDVNEDMHDKSCIIDQQLQGQANRSLKVSRNVDLSGFDVSVPVPTDDDVHSLVLTKDGFGLFSNPGDAADYAAAAQNAANVAQTVGNRFSNLDLAITQTQEYANVATTQATVAVNAANSATSANTSASSTLSTIRELNASTSASAISAQASAVSASGVKDNVDNIVSQLTSQYSTYAAQGSVVAPAVDTSLSVTGQAADSKVVGELFNNFTNNIGIDVSIPLPSSNIATGWKLLANGSSTSSSTHKLVKYPVKAGDLIHISASKDSEGVFQFQSTNSVPSSNNNKIVGGTHTSAYTGYIAAPAGATWLIVSQSTTNTTNYVRVTFENYYFVRGAGSGYFKIYSDGRIAVKHVLYVYNSNGKNAGVIVPEYTTTLDNYDTLEMDMSAFNIDGTPSSNPFRITTYNAIDDGCIPVCHKRNNVVYVNPVFSSFFTSTLYDELKDNLTNIAMFTEQAVPYTVGNNGSGWYNRINLIHISDTHITSTNAENNLLAAIDIAENIHSITSNIKEFIVTGDLTNGMSLAHDTLISQLQKVTAALNTSSIKWLAQTGNHDANDNSASNYSNALTKEDTWTYLFTDMANQDTGIVWGDENNSGYCYRDIGINDYYVRIIMLDSLDHPNYTADNTKYNGQWNEVYSQAQINWLCNTALRVPANYGIIICNHFPFAPYRTAGYSETYPALNDGYFVQSSTGNRQDGWKMIPEIVEAWQNRTTLSKTYYDTVGSANITVNANFSGIDSSAQFVCYLCGHTHSKNNFWVEEENGKHFNQLMLCEDSSGQNGSALNRAYKWNKGAVKNAFSLLSIDMRERKIYRTAYGSWKKCSDVDVKQTQVFSY